MGIGPFFAETSNHAENSKKIVTYPAFLRAAPAWAASICPSPFTESFNQDKTPVLTRHAPKRVPTHSRTASTSFVVGRMTTHGHTWGRLVFRFEPLPNESPLGYLCRAAHANRHNRARQLATIVGVAATGFDREDRAVDSLKGFLARWDEELAPYLICPQAHPEAEKQYSSAGELIARQPPVRNLVGCGSKLATVLRVVMNGSLVPVGRPERPSGSIGYVFLSGDRYRVPTGVRCPITSGPSCCSLEAAACWSGLLRVTGRECTLSLEHRYVAYLKYLNH
jgi:hypothetical protein